MKKQRTPFLIVGDGKTEEGFYKFIDKIAKSHSCHVHFNVEQANSGSPQTTIDVARRLRDKKQKFKVIPNSRVWVCCDTEDYDTGYLTACTQSAHSRGFNIVWQRPCCDCLILFHLDQARYSAGQNCQQCLRNIVSAEKGYKKGVTKEFFQGKIGISDAQSAAGVFPDYGALLRTIGLI